MSYTALPAPSKYACVRNVSTPVFHEGEIIFFTASRGHHADIGGIAPGSMPPGSTSLEDEGAMIVAYKLVRDGQFQEEGITEILRYPGRLKGNSGTRNLSDNLSDLRAQVRTRVRRGTFVARTAARNRIHTPTFFFKFPSYIHRYLTAFYHPSTDRTGFFHQVAANNSGIRLLQQLVREYGLFTVEAYMKFIQVSRVDRWSGR